MAGMSPDEAIQEPSYELRSSDYCSPARRTRLKVVSLDQGSGHAKVVIALKEMPITGNWGCRDVSHATIPSRQSDAA
jgi:hypothetical protein